MFERCARLGMLVALCSAGLTSAGPTAAAEPAANADDAPAVKSLGPGSSLTIFPISLGGDTSRDVADVVGLMLERDGFSAFEMTDTAFKAPTDADIDALASAFAGFVQSQELKTEYGLYAEYVGTPGSGVSAVRAVIADKKGGVAWKDVQSPGCVAFDRVKPRNPMTCCVLLHERLRDALSIDTTGKQPAHGGKMEKRWERKSGLPDKAEREAIEQRVQVMKRKGADASVLVYPARVGQAVDSECATRLAEGLNADGLCKATALKDGPLLEVAGSSNEQRVLWNLARAAKTFVAREKPDADYVLLADYLISPRNNYVRGVHFVVCDRAGDWVLVDFQNEYQPEYKRIKPRSRADCDRVVIARIKEYLQ